MKKVLLLTALLIGCFVQSQNIDLLHKANKCDLTFAKSLSDEISTSAKTKYVYLTSKESTYLNLVTFVYIKDDLSDSDKKSIEAYLSNYTGRYELQLDNCLCVHFKVNKVGENKDLEIKGTKEYVFDNVKGKYLDLFAFYQKNIEPTATTEKTTTTGIYSTRKDKDGYWYNFARTNTDGLWYLKNMSSRLN
ncbi:hypothetical protein [Flavobacterium gilvum]|uniref:Lipoprotein n=1 Tax=Flavobacterium gilvum TaxID=1492737 RepID=A0AAC9I4M7_9FLAO|nr:hypothetical protein [Flavobacterium gilvum]AOW09502.1 hypothetical protein EM308_08320 [Flavobacterium gilvum]KFC60008.1 hypothetical protein FEM08_11870 [Flavobacterium gilvum]